MSAKHSDQVAIFWDFENCRPSSNVTGNKVLDRVRTLVQGLGCITTLRAYVDVSPECTYLRSNQLYSDLQSSGCSLIHCPHNGKKDVADKMMIVDMLVFAMDKPAPATIVIITGDRDFAYAAAILRLRGYRIVIIAPPSNSHGSLKQQADQLYDWQKDVLEACDGNVTACSSTSPRAPSASHRSSLSLPPISVVQEPLSDTVATLSSNHKASPAPEPEVTGHSRSNSVSNATHSSLVFGNFQRGSPGPIDAESFDRSRRGNVSEPLIYPLLPGNARPTTNSTSQGIQETGINVGFGMSIIGESHLVPSPSIEQFGSPVAPPEFEASASLTSGSDVSTPSTGASIIANPIDSDEDTFSVANAYSCISGTLSESSLDAVGSASVGRTRFVETGIATSGKRTEFASNLAMPSVERDISPSCSPVEAEPHYCLPTSLVTSASGISPQPRAPDPSSEEKPAKTLSVHATVFTPRVVSPAAAARDWFEAIISLFIQRRASGKPTRIISSEVGSEMKKRDPQVYEKAGVTKLKSYIEEAREAGIVVSPGLDDEGTAWVEIDPALYSETGSSVKQEVGPICSSDQHEKSTSHPATASQTLNSPSQQSTVSLNLQKETERSPPSQISSTGAASSSPISAPPPIAARKRFRTLITLFIERKCADLPTRLNSSEVAAELLKRDPNVYEDAGVSKLKEYIEEARKEAIVVSPGLDRFGSTWVEINPVLYSHPTIDTIYVPLVDRLRSETPSYRLLYSALGMFVKQQHPALYKRASVSGLTAYLQKAEKDEIISLGRGLSPGSEWAELRPIYCKSDG